MADTSKNTSVSSNWPTWTATYQNCTLASVTATATTTTTRFHGVEIALWITHSDPTTCDWALPCSTLKPNPDILGLGVVIAFLVSAYALLGLVLWSYFQGLLPGTLVRRVDSRLFFANSRNAHSRWRGVVEETMLVISDQQLIAGLCIPIAGFIQVFYFDLSVYHWNAVIYLAWTSSTIHLMTITVLRERLNANKILRNIRLFVIFCILASLLAALTPTSKLLWSSALHANHFEEGQICSIASPAKCFFDHDFLLENAEFGSPLDDGSFITPIFLVLTYIWKVSQLFQPSRKWTRLWGRARAEAFLEGVARQKLQHPTTNKWLRGLSWALYKLVTRVYITHTLVAELLDCFMATVLGLVTILARGTIKIIGPYSTVDADVQTWEHEMGYGQILPMLLLLQPAFTMLQLFLDKNRQSARPAQTGNSTRPSPSVFPTLAAALSDPNLQLLSAEEKVSGQLHDPIIEHLYTSKLFKALLSLASLLYSTALAWYLLSGWNLSNETIYLMIYYSSALAGFMLLSMLVMSCSTRLN